MVNRLSEGSQADINDLEIPASVSRQEAAEIVVGILEHMARRADAQAARGALLFELRDDVELRELLTAEAPVRRIVMASINAKAYPPYSRALADFFIFLPLR